MSAQTLLERLHRLGAALETDGDRLRIKAGKGAITPELLAQMKAQKADLIALLSRPAARAVPQSDNQAQLWFLDRLQPDNPMYNNPLALRITGACDAAAMDRALQGVIARHAILRTTFFDREGEPWQRVHDASLTRLKVTDLSHADAQAETLAHAHATRPFDLEHEPGIRAALVTFAPDSHLLLVNVHHICADGWSVGILMEELLELYRAATTDQPAQLPDLRWQYADYVEDHRRRLTPEALAQHKAYWQKTLADAPQRLTLPTDRPRPAMQSFNGAHLRHTLPAELGPGIRSLCQSRGVTPFALFLATHAVVMTRYSGQDDICIGTPLAGRDRQELEPLIGHFINTVAIRVRLDRAPRFTDLLDQVNDRVLEAADHQDLAFEKVVEAVNPRRAADHAPLFQTMLIFQNVPSAAANGPVRIAPVTTDSATAKYEITIELFQEGDGFTLGVEYNTDLFDAATIAGIVAQFDSVIRAAIAAPDMLVAELPLVTPPPMTGALAQTSSATLQACFTDAAATWPDRIAVSDDSGSLTFAALQERALAVAGHLQRQGVTPGTRVALIADPDRTHVILMLASLQCGGAFVPIDPTMPAKRIAQMLADGNIGHVLADPELLQALTDEGYGGATFDRDAVAAAAGAFTPPQDENPLAAIVFTSGSTGRPKGALVSHAGLINLARWTETTFPGEGAVLQKSAIGFDASLWEFLWPLLSGRSLVIAQGESRKNPALLRQMVEAQAIAVLQFVPATLQLFLDGLEGATCPSLTHIFCGGGILTTDLARQVTEKLPHVTLVNVYGVTECSVDSTYHVYDPAKHTGDAVPIGQPISGTSILLRDALGRPVPRGAIGEICIGGTGVGDGYVNAPGNAFLHSVGGVPGRWFASADLGRINAQGQLTYLGRRDFQIKHHGFRMEPGEIETALRHCGCTGAVVQIVDDMVVAHVTGAADPATLRPALADLLPAYMIPSLIMPLDRFPLNANGKIDRAALPAPSRAAASNAVNQTTPRDAMELALYHIWKAILLHPDIGIRDNFFDVGGSSISAIKMLHRIRQDLGKTLTLRSIMTHPTIEELGALLREGGDATKGEEARVTFQRGNGQGAVICVHPAGGTAFCYLSLARTLDDGIGVYGLQSPGLNAGEALAGSVAAMAKHYLTLIADLQDQPLVITGLSFGGLVAHEMGRRLAESGKRDVSVVLLDTQGTHDAALRRQIGTVDMAEFRDKLVRFNGTYPGISDGQIQRYYEVYNHNRLTVRDYDVPVSAARIAFIQALSDLPRSFLHEVRRYWKSRTTGAFSTRLVRGDHWEMLETAELETVKTVILAELSAIGGAVE